MRHLALDVFKLPRSAERSHLGIVRQRITDADFSRLGGHPFQELIGDALLEVQPRAGDAALPGRAKNRRDGAVDRAADIDVIEYDERRLAAKLQRHLGEIVG